MSVKAEQVLNGLERCERAAQPQGSRQGLNAKSAKVVVVQAGRTSHLRGRAQQCKRQDTVESKSRNPLLPEHPERGAQRQLSRKGASATFADLVRAQAGGPDTRERGARIVRPREKQSFPSD